MANYNRTRLRPIDNTIANLYLSNGTLESTGSLAISFSFRGRNCLSPIGDLENNNLVAIDTIDPGVGFTGGATLQNIYPVKDLINLDGSMLLPSLIKIFIGLPKKYATSSTNSGFGDPITFNSPTSLTAGSTYIVMCTPFGYQNYNFTYTDDAP